MKTGIIVPTANVCRLAVGVDRLIARPPGMGALGLVEGAPGTGKTSAAKMLAQQYHGVYYSVPELETARSLLAGLVRAINGCHVEYSRSDRLLERFLYDLEERAWPPVMLDEGDRLRPVRAGYCGLEVVRDLHDRSRSPFILFSVSQLARRFAHPTGYTEVYTSRLGATVRFERASIEDAELLARELLEHVSLTSDLIASCWEQSRGSYRPLLGAFAEIERIARTTGRREISLSDWQKLAPLSGGAKPLTRGAMGSVKSHVVKSLRAAR